MASTAYASKCWAELDLVGSQNYSFSSLSVGERSIVMRDWVCLFVYLSACLSASLLTEPSSCLASGVWSAYPFLLISFYFSTFYLLVPCGRLSGLCVSFFKLANVEMASRTSSTQHHDPLLAESLCQPLDPDSFLLLLHCATDWQPTVGPHVERDNLVTL